MYIDFPYIFGSLWVQLPGAVLLLAFGYQFYFYLRYLYGVKRWNKRQVQGKLKFSQELQPLSVIICARDEEKNLEEFLPSILEQDYPEFEVIVVNDASMDDTDILLERFQKKYPHLRKTFVPDGTSNLSTKKLAVTLGVKAAKYDWLVFTDADCMVESKHWLRNMSRNFIPGTEIVLGYGAYETKKSFLNRMITYDTLLIAMQYLGFALQGKTYMGVGRNMAYRKDFFFNNKGFSSQLHLKSGDDDLLINKGAKPGNVRVEVAPDSVTTSIPEKSLRSWINQKERHLSVSVYYKMSSKWKLAREPLFRAFFYVSFILMLILGNWLELAIASLIFVLRFVFQAIVINSTAKLFGKRRYYLSILIFDIWLPALTAWLMLYGKMGRKSKNIRWK